MNTIQVKHIRDMYHSEPDGKHNEQGTRNQKIPKVTTSTLWCWETAWCLKQCMETGHSCQWATREWLPSTLHNLLSGSVSLLGWDSPSENTLGSHKGLKSLSCGLDIVIPPNLVALSQESFLTVKKICFIQMFSQVFVTCPGWTRRTVGCKCKI